MWTFNVLPGARLVQGLLEHVDCLVMYDHGAFTNIQHVVNRGSCRAAGVLHWARLLLPPFGGKDLYEYVLGV